MVTADLGHAQAARGQRAEAWKRLDELKERARRRYVPPYDFSTVYAGLGETDQAFRWLEKAQDDRSWWVAFLKVEPRLDLLRSDPRFPPLLRRMNLPE
jgi:hypothetical protein